MKQIACLLLATLVVFQLCNFIHAAPSEISEKEFEFTTSDSGGSYGISSGGSGPIGSQSGSSNPESENSSSSKDESTGKGGGIAMDKLIPFIQFISELRENIPWLNMFKPNGISNRLAV